MVIFGWGGPEQCGHKDGQTAQTLTLTPRSSSERKSGPSSSPSCYGETESRAVTSPPSHTEQTSPVPPGTLNSREGRKRKARRGDSNLPSWLRTGGDRKCADVTNPDVNCPKQSVIVFTDILTHFMNLFVWILILCCLCVINVPTWDI